MKIGAFSNTVKLSKDTIRYYEKFGLIKPKLIKKQRYYTTDDVATINIVAKLKRNGFKLAEIKAMLELTENMNEDTKFSKDDRVRMNLLKKMFDQKYVDILEREREIQEIKAVFHKINDKIDNLLTVAGDE